MKSGIHHLPNLTPEDTVRQYKDRLEHACKAGNIGIFDVHIPSRTVWWSEEQALLMEQKHVEGYIDYSMWATHVHDDDKKRVEKAFKTIVRNLSSLDEEFRVMRPDGSYKWVRCKGDILLNTTGSPDHLVGVCYDITERKQIADTLEFLNEASKILSTSLDYKTTLQSVSSLAVPHIADWCSVDILDKNGDLQLVAVAHKDPKKVKWAISLRKNTKTDLSAPTGLPLVLRTGKTEYYPLITAEMIDAGVKTKKERNLIAKIGFTSIIIVPLRSKGTIIGAITLVTAESKRRFTTIDVHMAEQLATRASLAIENTLLYDDVKREKERLNDLVATVPGVVWEAWGNPSDPSQPIHFVNSHVETMLGYTVEEWINTPNFWLTIVHPEDKALAAKETEKIFKNGTGGTVRFRWIAKSGKVLYVEAQSYVIKDATGTPVGMRGVTMDISQRMELERRKDEFISMASHELKTPITSIKVFTQLMQRKISQDPAQITYLQRMDNQIDKLTNLVNDLLDVSKIQAGKLELRKDLFSLDALVAETIETIQATTKHKIQLQGSVRKKVCGDKDRVEQVLINFLSNAIKYSPDAKEILVSIRKNNQHVEVSVQDFGIGIADEHIDKIFNRFYRVYDNHDQTFPGLGMGLYISSVIIKRHQGTIWFESKPGKGSTFYFSLPFEN